MTRTEAALQALRDALEASAALPEVRRNEVLDAVLEAFETADGAALVLRDGQGTVTSRAAGTGPDRFELEHRAEIEWLVTDAEETVREARFDEGLDAIEAAIAADPTLGGVVDHAEISEPPERDTEAAGFKPVKTARLLVDLLFTSSRPF